MKINYHCKPQKRHKSESYKRYLTIKNIQSEISQFEQQETPSDDVFRRWKGRRKNYNLFGDGLFGGVFFFLEVLEGHQKST